MSASERMQQNQLLAEAHEEGPDIMPALMPNHVFGSEIN
jgi:hypothetical protein